MFIATLFLLNLAAGTVDTATAKERFPTMETCQAVIDHDLPVVRKRAEELFPGEFKVSGLCTQVEKDDGSI